jgi:hypothetical protein
MNRWYRYTKKIHMLLFKKQNIVVDANELELKNNSENLIFK